MDGLLLGAGRRLSRPKHRGARDFAPTTLTIEPWGYTTGAMQAELYPCPCCGHCVFAEPPGSQDICLVCFWEDDVEQLRWPDLAGLTNTVSLRQGQQNRARFGAIEERFAGDVRPATAEEPPDPSWRPIHDGDPFEAPDDSAPWPEDRTRLYYWRPSFWRRAPEA